MLAVRYRWLRGAVSGAVIFPSVNQVLVRLWACRGQPSLTGCVGGSVCSKHAGVAGLRDRGDDDQRRYVYAE